MSVKVGYAAFNSISVISQRLVHLSMCIVKSSLFFSHNNFSLQNLNYHKSKILLSTLVWFWDLLIMSNLTFFRNVFYAICIIKSFYSHISVVVCSFFEFGTVSKWRIREWVNPFPNKPWFLRI